MSSRPSEAPPALVSWGLPAVALAAILWAVAATAAGRLFERGVPPLELAASRSFCALFGFMLLRRWWAPARRPAPRWLLPSLGVAIALVNLAYYVAIDRLPVAVAIVVQYTAPVLVVAWAALVARRRPSSVLLGTLVAAVIGVSFVAELPGGRLGDIDLLGLGAAAAAAILFASYTVLSERASASFGPVGAMARAFAFASAMWVVVLVALGPSTALLSAENLPWVLYVGFGGTLAPFLLYVWGIERVRAERATIAATLEPPVAAVVAWVWLGQSLTALQLFGGALILGAVTFLQVRAARADARAA